MKLAQDEFHQSLYLFIDCQCIGYPLLLTTYTYHEHQCHHDEFFKPLQDTNKISATLLTTNYSCVAHATYLQR